MGTIQIKKVAKTVTTGKQGETRQKVKKTYGKIIYRGTLSLNDMAEHIMKHGTVYTEDVVIGVDSDSGTDRYGHNVVHGSYDVRRLRSEG